MKNTGLYFVFFFLNYENSRVTARRSSSLEIVSAVYHTSRKQKHAKQNKTKKNVLKKRYSRCRMFLFIVQLRSLMATEFVPELFEYVKTAKK